MGKQMGLTMIALVLLMTTVEIDGGNRFQSITTTTCCRKGGAIYPSTESPTPAPSSAESPLTVPLNAPLPAKSHHVQYLRGRSLQQTRVGGIQSENRGGSMQSESRAGGITSENRGGSLQSEFTAAP